MGKKVLYIAARAPESLPMDDEFDNLYHDILKNITFSYPSDASQLVNFFMGLQPNYQPKPNVIVIDFLHTVFDYFPELNEDVSLHTNFIECHMLITAALYGAVDMFSRNATNFISIICIDPQCHDIYKEFIQRFVDLYYYNENSILSLNDLEEIVIE